jgi:hypothetical protein
MRSWKEFGDVCSPIGTRKNLKVPKQVLKAVYFVLSGGELHLKETAAHVYG